MRVVMTFLLALLTSVGAWATGGTPAGSGTSSDPYVIADADDWTTFVGWINNSNGTYGSKCYKLGADITISSMAGTKSNMFKGTFDGDGHTMTLDNLSSSGEFCAPFRYVYGATIMRLHTTGTVIAGSNTSNDKYRTGLVGDSRGTTTISNCWSSVTITSQINGDGTHGGFVGVVSEGTLTLKNCLFDGTISGDDTYANGGFVGWTGSNTTNINNCLMAGTISTATQNGATFMRGSSDNAASNIKVNNSYYVTAHGTAQGTAVGDKTNVQLQTALGDAWEISGGKVVPIMSANNLSIATVSGLTTPYYTWTGSPIAVDYTVTDANGNTLTKGTDYTATISPATVQEVGEYTLTITGKGSYTGTKVVTFEVRRILEGSGTAADPYLIGSDLDWGIFVNWINNENNQYASKYYKLTADITVTSMVGTSDQIAFKGTFDGDGHTMTLNLTSDGDYCAPFRYCYNATVTIKRLHVTGTINTSHKYAAGLVGRQNYGTLNLINCWSSVTINSSSDGNYTYNGGFVGYTYANNNITNCRFDGKLLGASSNGCGGFVGYRSGYTTEINDCLYAPTEVTMGKSNSYTFIFSNALINNSYYTETFGVEQGTAIGSMTNAELLQALGHGWEISNNKVVPIQNLKNLKAGSITCDTIFYYTGSEMTVTPTVKDMDGNTIDAANYSVVISPSTVRALGNYTMTVTANANGYSGTLTHAFEVIDEPIGIAIDRDYKTNELGYYYTNMPYNSNTTIDLGPKNFTTSFKIYDEGGKNNDYKNNCSGILKIIAPTGYVIQLTGTVNSEQCCDNLAVYDGGDYNCEQLGDYKGQNANIGTLVSTGSQMCLYFHSDGSGVASGLDLTVSLHSMSVEHNVTVHNPTIGGHVTANPTTATVNTPVALTVEPDNGYVLGDIEAIDENNRAIDLTSLLWYNNTLEGSFTMSTANVDITPSFTNVLSAAGGLCVKMPKKNTVATPLLLTIPNNVSSFKILDDGGQNGDYSNNCDSYLLLTAPDNCLLKLTGTLNTYSSDDYLVVYDGNNTNTKLGNSFWGSSSYSNVGTLVSTGTQMLLHFYSNGDRTSTGLNLTLSVINPTEEHDIVVNNPTKGGKVTASANSAVYGDEVSLTIKADPGYALDALTVTDANGKKVDVPDFTWYNVGETLTFTMPECVASVTPTFTAQPSVNMKNTGKDVAKAFALTLPSTVTSFKVYDNGGPDGNYIRNFDGYLQITAPTGKYLQVDGSVSTEGCCDWLTIYEGNTTNSWIGMAEKYKGSDSVAPVVIGSNQLLLYFHSDPSNESDGLNLTVTVVDADNAHTVTVDDPTGMVSASESSALYGATITLNINPKDGKLLKNIVVKTDDNQIVDVTDALWYTGATSATFNMPYSNVTITPEFTTKKTIEGGLFVNMPKTSTVDAPKTVTIPAGLQAFKVYDDGGAEGQYSANCNGYLLLTAPEGCTLRLTGNVKTGTSNDYYWLTVYDGATNDKHLGNYKYYNNAKVPALTSTGNKMLLYFTTGSTIEDGLDLTVTVIDPIASHPVVINATQGGTVTASPSSAAYNTNVELTVAPDATYMLNDFRVTDAGGQTLDATDVLWYTGKNTSTFTMPGTDVIVTPTFTNDFSAEGGLYVNMPAHTTSDAPKTVSIPAGVTSFKVYDVGGKDGKTLGTYYSYMLLTAPEGKLLQLTGKVKGHTSSRLTIFDGPKTDNRTVMGRSSYGHYDGEGEDIGTLLSTGNQVMLSYYDYTASSEGIDLTVTVIDPNTQNNITVENPSVEIGTVSADPSSAIPNTEITLSVNPATGYMLNEFNATDACGNAVDVQGGVWYSGSNTATFNMPASNVTVAPAFTNVLSAAEGGLYVNMPYKSANAAGAKVVNIPANVTSFKVYDDGGKDNNHYYSGNGYLLLNAPEGYLLRLSGTVTCVSDDNYMQVYDGNTTATVLGNNTYGKNEGEDIGVLTSSGQQMLLYFYSSSTYSTYSGLDLTVTLVSAATEFDITVNNPAQGGTITASVESTPAVKATAKTVVTLTSSPSAGFLLNELTVKNSENMDVALSGNLLWYGSGSNTATFTMPGSNVTVTPTYTNVLSAAEGGLSVNIPKTTTSTAPKTVTVPNGVSSFKVYDEGGKDSQYSNGCSGYLLITAPEGYQLTITGKAMTETNYDYLKVYDGNTTSSRLGKEWYGYSKDDGEDIGTLVSTGNQMLLYFRSDGSGLNNGLDLTVNVMKSVALADNDSEATAENKNSAKVDTNDGELAIVTLKDRTLYKDGEWNTICLPFNVTLAGSPLEGATAKTLIDATNDGSTVTLSFGDAVSELVAGTPYIIKWDAAAENLVEPVFRGVTIDKTDNQISLDGGNVKFIGYYDALPITSANDDIYYMTVGNVLRHTGVARTLNACRAYFKFANPSAAREFVLDFGDSQTTGIMSVDADSKVDNIYDLGGRKMNNNSRLKKGLYIQNGKKTVIK